MVPCKWKYKFSNTILNRGRDYFENGHVYELDCAHHCLKAVVCGSDDYEVEIHFADGEILSMTCDCPYAEDGNNCKHMAAVLFAWEEGTSCQNTLTQKEDLPKEINSVSDKLPGISLEDAVKGLSAEKARELLLEYARTNSGLTDRILTLANGGVSLKPQNDWKRDLHRLQRKYHVNEYGEIYYQYIDQYLDALLSLFYAKVEPLANSGFYKEAFERLCDLMDAATVDGNESSEDYGELMEEGVGLLKQMLQAGDMDFKRTVYRECLKRCDGGLSAYNPEVWQGCLLHDFQDGEFLRQNLRMIDEALEGMLLNVHEHWLCRLVQYGTDTMTRLGYDKAELSEYRRRFWHYEGIRRMEWEDAINQQNWPRAVFLLRECKQLDSEQPHLLREYSRRLCDIFEKQNDLSSLKEELEEAIFTYCNRDSDLIQMLKRISTKEEWDVYLHRLLGSISMAPLRHRIFAEEGMYRELLNELETEPFLMGLQQYESLLKPYFAEEIRDVFFAYLRKSMEQAGNREAYATLIQRLKKMKDYPDGKDMARELAQEWRIRYKRKSALMEELKRAGF